MNSKLLTFVIAIFIIVGCKSQKERVSHLNGTWQLVSYQYGHSSEKTVGENLKKIKLITANHFVFVHYGTNEKMLTSTAGGRISYDGKTYVETIDFADNTMKNYLDNKQTFTVRLDNDKMFLEGQLSDGLKIKEVWQKLE